MQIPVRIVLVEPTHPGNIGAAARAMKTMGLTELALVRPQAFPSDEATARAAGARDVLERAAVHDSLLDAIAECSFIVGTSARSRAVEWPTVEPRECAARIVEALEAGNRAAIVFGTEHSGLTNDALARCTLHVQIPTQPHFSSLNLAMAVQLLCYELRLAMLAAAEHDSPHVADIAGGHTGRGGHRFATAEELEGFNAHLERVLVAAGFLRDAHPRQMKLKLRRIFQRAVLDKNEIDILRGVLTALDPAKRVVAEREE